MTAEALDNPILNSPYEAPTKHFALGPNGPTGEIKTGRRRSESFIPIPVSKKGKSKESAEQVAIDFDLTGERREENSLINDIRARVELWRSRQYPGVTPSAARSTWRSSQPPSSLPLRKPSKR